MLSVLAILTAVHTALSIVGIAAGLLALGNLTGRVRQPWVPTFLILAWTTTITGYFFPFTTVTPAMITGVVAIAFLVLVYLAQNRFNLAGRWRTVYAASMVASVYLLVFVAVVQAFLKVPALHALAPTGNEPPFAITQAVTLVLFIALGFHVSRKFKKQNKKPARRR